jgi:hypothetical protein
MPFTLAHPAAALPFHRTRLLTSALVIGTCAPDLEYFVRLSPGSGFGHTLAGAFVLTLPLALVTLWLFHRYVKRPAVALLPQALAARLQGYLGEFRFRGRFGLIVVSLLVGIATHLAWDSFTHNNTWLYRNLDILHQPVHVFFLGYVQVYKALQHVSTLLGLGVLLVYLAFWYFRTAPHRSQPPALPSGRKAILLSAILAIATVGGIVRAAISGGLPTGLHDSRFIGLLAVTSIALVWWQLVAFGWWFARNGDAGRLGWETRN